MLSVRVLLSLALQILQFMPKGNLWVAPYDKQGGSEDYFKPEFQQPHRQQTDNIKKVESMKKQIKNKPPKTVAKLCTGLCLTKS